jgi:hypothetical protein
VGRSGFARPVPEGRGLGEDPAKIRKEEQFMLGEDLGSTKANLRSMSSPKSA